MSVLDAGPSLLRRELGRWDLTAIGVNQVIGAAVFAQPALLASAVGAGAMDGRGRRPGIAVAGAILSVIAHRPLLARRAEHLQQEIS